MLIDISPPIDASIRVWPGDTPFEHDVSDIRTTVHVGAHADAPLHIVPNGSDIASRRLDYYVGRCVVLRLAVHRGTRIVPEHLEGRVLSAPRILLYTGTFPDPRKWNDDFASLSSALVEHLYQHGVMLVGIDTPSVDPFDSKSLDAHQAFARNDMAMLEGLVLNHVAEGEYELIAPPLRILGVDASPVRALLRTLD
jgi:arylformamidase